MRTGIFQRFFFHITSLRFDASLMKTKHFENVFIYLKLVSTNVCVTVSHETTTS